MKKKYFVCSDIHGFYTELQTALKKKGFEYKNPNHIIIVCGDLLDRGGEAQAVVDFFYTLHKRNRVILIRGNHEDLFERMIKSGYTWADVHNKTLDTLGQLCTIPNVDPFFDFEVAKHSYDNKWDYLRVNMLNYAEIGDYIFVHGWIPSNLDWRNARDDFWESARWKNGIAEALSGNIVEGKTIVCGHWHSSYGHVRKKNPGLTEKEYKELEFKATPKMNHFRPFKSKGIIAIDGCTAFSGIVNVLVLELEEN